MPDSLAARLAAVAAKTPWLQAVGTSGAALLRGLGQCCDRLRPRFPAVALEHKLQQHSETC